MPESLEILLLKLSTMTTKGSETIQAGVAITLELLEHWCRQIGEKVLVLLISAARFAK